MPEQRIFQNATRGMLHFRMGESETGREFYLRAVEQSRWLNNPEVLASALLHLAYEESRSGNANVDGDLILAMEFAAKSEKLYSRAIALRIVDRVNKLKAARQAHLN